MKCVNCEKSSDTLNCVLMNCDGDFACSPRCAEEYKRKRDHFLNVTLPDDEKYAAWLGEFA